jgi:hypothetical protein
VYIIDWNRALPQRLKERLFLTADIHKEAIFEMIEGWRHWALETAIPWKKPGRENRLPW